MFCSGDREKGPVALEEQWDYINLDDFKSESCLSPFSYFFLYVFLLISIAVYGVDTFTAVNLLAFSRWAGQIEPAIPFKISRWIFAVCIIISFALLIYRWLRAIRAIRSGSIAQSYLDSLAVRVQSIRMGSNGRGWRRFLVFGELTKSKKGAEYVALFAYFAFESWLSTLFADGPRQVVNAITLYSVMQMDLLPGGSNTTDEGGSGASQFFDNMKVLAEDNTERAVVLIGMLFTLVIWVLSMLKLILAVVLYLIFLFHHIPSEDGSLKAYCKRKINSRLTRIVRRKVNKALAKGVALQDRKPTNPNMGLDKRPTLPSLGAGDDDKTPVVTTISRTTTQTTLPAYSSRPGTAAPDRNPTLPDVGAFNDKPGLSRTMTESSAYSDAASLSGSTAVSAYSPLDRHGTPAPPVPPVPPLPKHGPAPMPRSQTPRMPQNFNQAPAQPGYNSPMERSSPAPSMPRTQTPMSRSDFTPAPRLPGQQPGPVSRLQTPVSRQGFTPTPSAPGYGPVDRASAAPQMPRTQTTVSNYTPGPGYSQVDRASPAPQVLRNQTPVSRSNFTPGPGYGPTVPGTRGPGEGYRPFETYQPQHDPYGPPSSTPFRPYSPAIDPNTRSLTPVSAFPGDRAAARTFSPFNQPGAAPYPAQENEYPLRSFSPATSHGLRSQAAAPADALGRTFSPVNAANGDGYVAFSPVANASPSPFASHAISAHDGYSHESSYDHPEPQDYDMPHSSYNSHEEPESGYMAFSPAANAPRSPFASDAISAHHEANHEHLDHLDHTMPHDYSSHEEPESGYSAFNPAAKLSSDLNHASPFEDQDESHIDAAHESTGRPNSESYETSQQNHKNVAYKPSAGNESPLEGHAETHENVEMHTGADVADNSYEHRVSSESHDVLQSHYNHDNPTTSSRKSSESEISLQGHHEQATAEQMHGLEVRPVSPLSLGDLTHANDGFATFNPSVTSPARTETEHNSNHHTQTGAVENPFENSNRQETRPSEGYRAFSPSVRSPATPTLPNIAPYEHHGQSPARTMSPQGETSHVKPYRPDYI
ncbi:pheromone-regulated membrane protein [Aspergillus costaricaensis CBS 115574]|uniref:Pheromone-regulated membrane protein n=1 Tax=Aspergillus costaricaensis CBS 115574 TaxID=1448317 RepID=A0ACD1I5J3_9EURO|nr:pheromone-regulated membrane protein [Aspergillus costaricaensis CBS 115574]RAK85336.1 pheromone-regulated membrane protein [Aspergillus costaricaensis CBS 115574]